MSKIRIRNFGPIKEGFDGDDGFMDIKKVTLFIGEQGSGKSTVAKLFSMFSWLEKELYRGDMSGITAFDFMSSRCGYYRIDKYFKENTKIDYVGEIFSFSYLGGEIHFHEQEGKNGRHNRIPKIMYVPSERNFLSSVGQADDVKGLPPSLFTFLDEFIRSQEELTLMLDLPIRDLKLWFDELTKTAHIIGTDYNIKLLEASSGLQSFVPLFLVSHNLALSINKEKDPSKVEISVRQSRRMKAEITSVQLDSSLAENEKIEKIRQIEAIYKNNCFINVVEEPEQNLFPISQRQILNSLIEFANMNEGNKLIMTTHSPYIINYLSIAIQAYYLKQKIGITPDSVKLLDKLYEIVPEHSTVAAEDVVIYELQDGKIIRLSNYEGIPSDKNYLNQSLVNGNQLFDSLLEIEQDYEHGLL